MTCRVLFVSFASYLDDANGASVASRAMMEAPARRDFAIEVLCGPILELGREIDLVTSLAEQGVPVEVCGGNTWETVAFGARAATPEHWHVDRTGYRSRSWPDPRGRALITRSV